jgi:methyl-accepting chemotaxis protein
MKWKISTKLGIGFGTLLFLMVCAGVTSFRDASSGVQTGETLKSATAELASVGTLRGDINEARINSREFMRSGSDSSREGFLKLASHLQESYDQLKGSVTQGDRTQKVERMGELLTAYLASTDKYFSVREEKLKEYNDAYVKSVRELSDQIRALSDNLAKSDSATAKLAMATLNDISLWRVHTSRYYFAFGEEDLAAARKLIKSVSTDLDELRSASRSGVDEMLPMFQAASAGFENVVNLTQQERELELERIGKMGAELSSISSELSEHIQKESTELAQGSVDSLAASRSRVMVLMVVALVLGAASALAIGISISRAIARMLSTIQEMTRDNDLTQRADEARSDELGDIAKCFNQFVSRVRGMIKEVSSSAQSVAAASTEIAASSEQMSAGLQQQQAQTSQVSAAVEEMSHSVVEVANKSADAAKFAESSGTDATTGGQVVEKTVREMRGIAEQVDESARAVKSLGEKSEQIGQIIGVINDIADQTNLLALNAAIEAARAGEHGRGFAVVADEVRKLAERTQKATEEVAQSIREIQAETSKAVETMEAGTVRVSAGVELASSAGQALSKITSSSKNLQSMVHSIASAAHQQSAASEQIARSVERINAVSRESVEGSTQAAGAAIQLSEQAERLQGLVSQFKV